MCGEKDTSLRMFAGIKGSPPRVRGKGGYVAIVNTDKWITPRVRGKVALKQRVCDDSGITPACAGKSTRKSRKRTTTRDHPRVCGEKVFGIPISVSNMGSPPRVRGKVVRPLWKKCSMRITPACAGKRLKKSKKINNPSPLAHRISFSFSYTANVRRQSVSARCAPETSRPKYVASVVSL